MSVRVRNLRVIAALCLAAAVAACGSREGYSKLLAVQEATGAANSVTASNGGAAPGATATPTGTPSVTPGAVSSNGGVASAPGAQTTTPSGPSTPSSPSTPSGPSTGPVANASCTAEKDPINVGTVGELSGIIGGLILNQVRGVQAWVAYINDTQGGIDCHPIKYITADDGGDPARNQALTQQLVEQDHVIAFVNMVAPLAGAAAVSYINQKQIPVVGSEGGSQWFYTSPYYFPQESSGILVDKGGFDALADVGKSQGKTKIATLSCIEASVCSEIYTYSPQFATDEGVQLVYRGQGSLAQPDFTSACQSAKDAGAQMFLIGLDTNSIERVLQNCKSVGFHPIYAAESSTVTSSVAADQLADGLVIGLPNAMWIDNSNRSIVEFKNALAKYAPGLPADLTSLPGWVSAKLFQFVTQNLPDPPTSQAILHALWSIKNNTLGGLTIPLTYAQGQNAPPIFCYWIAQVKNGGFSTPNGGARACK
jgi:branched-chain amino acid transport system substrate-binding protein